MNNNCAKCGAEFNPDGIKTGYATLPDNSRICYACADVMQREEMRDRSRPFVAYVSRDGRSVTTWTGGKLGDAYNVGTVRLTRRSYTHGATMNSYRVRDVHGNWWHGRGSPGIAITLRACKDKPARKTTDEWQVWGNYGYGWCEECAETTREEGMKRLREYRANGSGTYELRHRRVKVVA